MSSHILFPNIEPNDVPATMSRTIMHGLLRETLGFDGLILSDCMVMDAIRRHYGTAHGVVEAMRAGVDMVFVSSNADLQCESAAAALAAAESGSIDARELDGSAERILRAKERWIHPAEPESAGRAEDFAAAARMAREAVTAVRGKACRASEKTFFCGCADYRMTQASNADPEAKAFPEYMGARFGAKFAVCSKDPDEKEIADLVKCADGAENIIFSSCNAHLFRGQLALAAALAEKGVPMTVAALRNPYDLPLMPENAALLAAFDYSRDSLAALADVFSGGDCCGVMPAAL